MHFWNIYANYTLENIETIYKMALTLTVLNILCTTLLTNLCPLNLQHPTWKHVFHILVSPGVSHSVILHPSLDECSVTQWLTPGFTRMVLVTRVRKSADFYQIFSPEASLSASTFLQS